MRSWRAGVVVAGALVAAGCGGSGPGDGSSDDLIIATTTSTQDSGLLDVLLPAFEEDSGCAPKPVAVGSGQAMAMGESGDADVLLVHSPDAEREFMAAGHGTSRKPVMHNDFVVVGPPADPAGVGDARDAAEALALVAAAQAPFASRADDSGTHAKELELWEESGVDPAGSWYVETGQGMGETLTIADQKQAYTLSDRGTFLATGSLGSEIVLEGSGDLLNPYHVIVVDAEGTNTACAEEFATWIRSAAAQESIRGFGVDQYGEPLFVPDALD